jgi:hypothetical protein
MRSSAPDLASVCLARGTRFLFEAICATANRARICARTNGFLTPAWRNWQTRWTQKPAFAVWDRISGSPQRKKLSLAEYLEKMASLLREVRLKFEKREVPRDEAKYLAGPISDADALASVFKKDYPELQKSSRINSPRVARLMCDADFFIDKRPRYRLHESFDVDSRMFRTWAESNIAEACEELQRAAGIVSAYAFRFAQQAKRSKQLTK